MSYLDHRSFGLAGGHLLRRCGAPLLALSLLAATGCGEREARTPEDDALQDHTAGSGLSLREEEIAAQVGAQQSTVTLVLHRTGAAAVAGQASVQLVRLVDGEVLAAAQTPFSARTERTEVALPLTFGAPADQGQAALAGFALHYRVTWPGDAVWGRRSLFSALPLVQAQLLGPKTLQTGVPAQYRVLARNPMSGAPLADQAVTLALRTAATPADQPALELFSGRTDAFGQLTAALLTDADQLGPGTLQAAIGAGAQPRTLTADVAVERPTRILLTTDKPLYQPSQLMHLRALALRRPTLVPDAGAPIVFEIFDGRGNKVEHTTVVTDEFGIAPTTFRLAREVNLGEYRISATLQGVATEKVVTVDRYSLPKFDLDLQLDRAVYLAGSLLQGDLTARYFFGQACQAAAVKIVAATLDAGATPFAEVQGVTSADGLFHFQIQLPAYVVGLPLEQGGGLVLLTFEVTDSAGQVRTVTRTVRVARGELEAVIVPESGELVPGLVNTLLVRTRDAAGEPVATANELTVAGQPALSFTTDAEGLGSVQVPVASEQLSVRLVSRDDAGHEVTTEQLFTVGDPAGAVLLRTDRALYEVGDALRVSVETVGAVDRVYLDALRGGQTVLSDVLIPDAAGHASRIIELSPDHAGTLQLEAYTLARGASLRRDSKLVWVDAGNGLRIDVQPDRDVYRPGETATLRFRVTDEAGSARAAALGIQVVDEAVFGLTEFRPGLEKEYFQFEANLAEPRYQIGVPSLATLAAAPGAAEDPARQEQARLLFAASEPTAAYPVSIDSFAQDQAAVLAVVKPAIETLASAYAADLARIAQAGTVDQPTVVALVEAGVARPWDPWGQLMRAAMSADEQTIQLTSAGPDERWATADDLRVDVSIWQVLYGYDPGRGDWEQDGDWAAGGGGVPNAGGEGEAEPPSEDDGGKDAQGGAPRVRRDFPETLLVEPSLITDGSGTAELSVPLADSITTWRLSALANSADGLLGSTDAGLRVFQDFFVDLDFPAVLTRGDEYSVPVALYNYLDVPQTVRLEVQAGDWFTLLGPATASIELGPGEVTGVRLPLRVERVGQHELTVIALGDAMQDAVARSVLVEPDGHEVRVSESGRFVPGTVRRELTVPASAIEGSAKLLVKVYPGLLSSVVEGLDGVLQMPSGCFEQTSASTWPNVLVARYLRETGLVTPELDARAMEYVNLGYQRLLTFEVEGGGFEWFGSPPAHVVLTAYGLLEFTDMAALRPVDEAMIARTRSWLLSQQQADGHWEASRGLDETGNLTDPVTITAYVAFALAAAGERGAPLDRARAYLEPQLATMGSYTLALFANFLAAAEPTAPLTTRVLDELARRVSETVGGDGNGGGGGSEPADGRHWETDEQTTTYGNGQPAWIETTALATHALLVGGAHLDVAGAAIPWLVSKKDSYGAWGSTAGTVWTIKSLLRALGGRDETADATVEVRFDGQTRATFRIVGENSDVLRQADLSGLLVPGQTHVLELAFTGQGNLQYGIVSAHHEPWNEAPPPEGPLSITVAYDRTQLAVDDTIAVSVTVANQDAAFADMVMVDLGIPPGFDLVHDDLRALVAAGVFSKYESTPRQLLLYFTRIAPGQPVSFSYRIVARDPIRAEAPASRVYSYYNPEVGSSTEPVAVEVEE